ncbi:phosphatidate cytidylyltransferase [Egicoccus halophilus]|uniref:Phosphatidate cytidylyltransferase n=1 Tax=Egicoccus halophilus TaxID=1670830 RepID=A0A8J3A8G8_9ACTN|nr:phosphatidate cytidylyltransferase [Egicoccus halophilus]GGI06510.1 phosphatidate cytidylyltransferase [Egicoccus halophilus]
MSDATEPSSDGTSPSSTTRRRIVGGRDLPQAIAVGALLAFLFLGSLVWHPAAFTIVVGGLTVIGYVETGRVLRTVDLHLEVAVAVVATLVMLFGAYQAGHAGQAVGVAVLLVGGILAQLADGGRQDVVRTLGVTTLLGLWVGFLASYAVLLVNRPSGGTLVGFAVVGAAIFTDIGGYAFGVAVGRHRIAPSVSPNKTWEGLLGGVLTCVVLLAVLLPRFGGLFTWQTAAVLGAACGVASFVGDLTESMIKRDLGVKDLGEVLPGHGGVLDRVDGILLALPVGYYVVELLV